VALLSRRSKHSFQAKEGIMTPPNNSKIRFVMVELEGSDQSVAAAVATISNLIGHGQRTTDNGQSSPASPPPALAAETSAALLAPVHGGELSPPAGGERHAATASSEEPAVPRRRQRRTPPSAPASIAAPAQASKIPAAAGRKLRSDATLLECSDRPGFALTLQEIASKTGHPVPTIRGWMTKAGREWFTIDHLKYRRMVKAATATGAGAGGNGDSFYRPAGRRSDPTATASRGIRHPDELERDLADED
jgi:hypothetical protein